MQIPSAQQTALPQTTSVVAKTDSLLSHRAQLIRRASPRIPVTAEDLPVGFYRCDLLPFAADDNGTLQATKQLKEAEDLQAAYCELLYDQGYPTLPSGEPWWHKLDYEPGLAYGAFQIFLDETDEDARELTALAEHPEFLRILETQIGHPPTKQEALQTLQEYYNLYYWKPRARAHDLFKEAAYRHKRIQRAMSAEDYHYTMSTRLLKVVETYLNSEKFNEGLTPKVAIEALTKLVAIQRISAGLPSGGPLPTKDTPQSMDFEMILRTLGAQQANNNPNNQQSNSRQRNQVLDNILADPTTAKTMQELVIRITTSNFANNATTQNDPHQNNPGRREGYKPSEQEVEDAQLADDIEFHK